MSNRDCPCKGCVPPKRTPTCHSSCTDYAEWKSGLDAENAKIREVKKEYDDLFLTMIKRKRRRRK